VRPEHAPTIAVVTGLRAEARCLRGLSLRIACSGGSSERARTEATRLVTEGGVALVSFGLAGGLAPNLRPGDLLLPETVRLPDGRSVPTDQPWRERLRALFERGELRPTGGTLAGSDGVVATTADKQALREATGAVAVDMESHALAAVASTEGIPFLVVRAIADPHDQVVPQAALEALRPDGRVHVIATLGGVIRQPRQLIALIRLGRHTAAALATLRRGVPLGKPDLGYDRRSRWTAGRADY
jgi:adenosylhomocysteine nucleosidase